MSNSAHVEPGYVYTGIIDTAVPLYSRPWWALISVY